MASIYTLKALVWLLLVLGAPAGLFWWLLRPADQRLLTLKPLGVALAYVACGMLSPNIYIFYAILAVTLPFTARSRGEAAAIYLASFLALPVIGQHLLIGSTYLFLASARDALTIGFLLTLAIRPRSRSPLAAGRPADLAFLLFFFILALTAARGRIATDTIRVVTERTLAFALPYYCLSRSIREPKDFRKILLVIAMMGTALAAEAAFESRRGWPLMLTLDTRFGDAGMAFYRAMNSLRGGIMRASGSFAEPISFSFFLALAFLACLTLRDAFRRRWGQYGVALVITVGLYYTGSRGGWLGAVMTVLLLDVFRHRYASLAAKAVVLAVAASLLMLAAQSSPWLADRIGMSGHAETTVDYRKQLATRGLEEFRHAPFFGRSPTAVYEAMADLKQGEGIVDFVNYWIYFLLVAGAVGTAVIAGAMLTPAVLVAATRRQLHERPGLLGIAGFLFGAALMPMAAILFSSFDDRYGLIWVLTFAMTASFVPMVSKLRRTHRPIAPAGQASDQEVHVLEPVG